ncbi:MAG: HNH endonuclease family protein [Candidatus Nanopelagicales bacterium]|nr:HNH endonuclease family protein [Candidatus Nanopelagicales bacterium]
MTGGVAVKRARVSGGAVGLLVLAVLASLVWAFAGGDDDPAPPDSAATAPAPTSERDEPDDSSIEPPEQLPFIDVEAARQALPELDVKGRAPLTAYSREAFGTAWSDVNDNGCDTRNDILRRDLTNKTVDDCVVLTGVLADPYSGRRVQFRRGLVTSLEVQIDHVVPLSNAWQTGASFWTPAQRERFANDRRNLLAVRGDLNLQKSDGDAATWLPPKKSFRCAYVSIQVLTKQRYDLWVTAPEKRAMQRILDRC